MNGLDYITVGIWWLLQRDKYDKFVYYVETVGVQPKYAIELVMRNE